MKKIFTLAAAVMMAASVSAQTQFTKKLDKTMVVYTTDDCQFVKYSDDEEEDVTTYYNDNMLQKSLKKVGLPLTLGTGNSDLHGAKKNIKYTLRNDFKDDATGFEIKAGQYRGLFVDGELCLGGEVFADGETKDMIGFTNLKQVVLYFVPIPNECVKSVYVYGDPSNGRVYGQGRLQVMYMNPDGTQMTNKAFRDTKVTSETLYEYAPNPVQKDAIYAPKLMNMSVKEDASKASGYDVSDITCDQPFKLVYNLDNQLDYIDQLNENKKDDYLDLKLAADQTEATVNYYFAKKEDTSAYADHNSADQETPIYSATGYNLWTDKVGAKAPWSPETIVRPYIKQYFYLLGYALVSATSGAATEYLNTNCDGNGDPTMKAFSADHIAAHGGAGTDGIANIRVDATVKSNAIYNIAGQKVGADYKGIVIKNGVKTVQ